MEWIRFFDNRINYDILTTKRKNLLALSTNMWIGTEVTIEADGTVFINGKDKYTPQELWLKGENHIPEL